MKYSKNTLIIMFLFAVVVTGLFAFGSELFAQTYSPLSPLPGDGGAINVADPGSYFARMFAIFVGVAAVIAVIMLVICGFQYMTSDAISSKEAAKKRCWAAILGLGLLLVSWLILNTINPNLLNLPFANLRNALKEGVINPETGAKGGGGGGSGSVPFCYITSDGKKSYADEATCNTARATEIGNLNNQITFTKGIRFQQSLESCFQNDIAHPFCPSGGTWCYYKYHGPDPVDRLLTIDSKDKTVCGSILISLIADLNTKITELESKKASTSSCSEATC